MSTLIFTRFGRGKEDEIYYQQGELIDDKTTARWITDITATQTAEGELYLAAVIDVFSRMVVGWAMGCTHNGQPVTDALVMVEFGSRFSCDVPDKIDNGQREKVRNYDKQAEAIYTRV